MHVRILLPLLCALTPLARPAGAPDGSRSARGAVYAVLPLRNLSADRAAARDLVGRLRARLSERGASVFIVAADPLGCLPAGNLAWASLTQVASLMMQIFPDH